MDLNELLQSLGTYSPAANDLMQAMAGSLRPVGLVLIALFFLIELTERTSELKLDGGTMTPRLLGELAFNYLIALLFVMFSQQIFNAMLELGNLLVKLSDRVVPAKTIDTVVHFDGIKGWLFKNIIRIVAQTVQWLSDVIVYLLAMMRFYQMYVASALAPIIVSFFVNRTLRSIAINFLKLFGAYALQGVVILIIVRLYPYIMTEDIFKIPSNGLYENLTNAFASIAKGIIYIFMVVGSGRFTKQIMGVS